MKYSTACRRAKNVGRWTSFYRPSITGWRLGTVEPYPCGQDDWIVDTQPTVQAVIGADPSGCLGDTLMTGFADFTVSSPPGSYLHSEKVYEVLEPIERVRWAGRLNQTDREMFFLATLVDPAGHVSKERRAEITAKFSETCGIK